MNWNNAKKPEQRAASLPDLAPGQYVLTLTKIIRKPSQKTGQEFFICEMVVKTRSSAEGSEPGTRVKKFFGTDKFGQDQFLELVDSASPEPLPYGSDKLGKIIEEGILGESQKLRGADVACNATKAVSKKGNDYTKLVFSVSKDNDVKQVAEQRKKLDTAGI